MTLVPTLSNVLFVERSLFKEAACSGHHSTSRHYSYKGMSKGFCIELIANPELTYPVLYELELQSKLWTYSSHLISYWLIAYFILYFNNNYNNNNSVKHDPLCVFK